MPPQDGFVRGDIKLTKPGGCPIDLSIIRLFRAITEMKGNLLWEKVCWM